ncbi:MAG: hypothetical protein AB9873_09315 [Syntrophobacteraceae bacterium]
MMKAKKGMLALCLVVIPGVVWGATTTQTERKGPPPPGFFMMGMSDLASDDNALYVLAGGRILIYALNDLNEPIGTVELPKPEPPSDLPPAGASSGSFPPHHPPMPPGGGLCVKSGTLYVLAGPVIHVYKTAESDASPGLTYASTFSLPVPEPPALSN